MKLRLGPYTLTLTLRRAPREPAPVPVPHAEGVRRLREEVAAAIPVDDGELERAKVVSPFRGPGLAGSEQAQMIDDVIRGYTL